MTIRSIKPNQSRSARGFTLIETLVAFGVFAMVSGGILYGYIQTNRMAEWAATSLAAQSYASQGAEQARAAKWDPWAYPQNANTDQWTNGSPPRITVGIFDIPIKGNPTNSNFGFFVTNVVTVTNLQMNPPLRQITSTVYWNFYVTGKSYTNTVILLRAPDQ
jgi:type II secretory pathway pseudopilin PulG